MESTIERLDEKYGEKWFTYQPPGALPFVITEVQPFEIPGVLFPFAYLKRNICNFTVNVNQHLILNYYALRLAIVKDNPNWFGLDYREGSPFDLLGRIWWQPVIQGQKPHVMFSITPDNVVYKNIPIPNIVTPNTEGLSLLQPYYKPRILVRPGETISLQINFGSPFAGMDPPPPDFTWMLVGEIRGYRLTDLPVSQIESSKDKRRG